MKLITSVAKGIKKIVTNTNNKKDMLTAEFKRIDSNLLMHVKLIRINVRNVV